MIDDRSVRVTLLATPATPAPKVNSNDWFSAQVGDGFDSWFDSSAPPPVPTRAPELRPPAPDQELDALAIKEETSISLAADSTHGTSA